VCVGDAQAIYSTCSVNPASSHALPLWLSVSLVVDAVVATSACPSSATYCHVDLFLVLGLSSIWLTMFSSLSHSSASSDTYFRLALYSSSTLSSIVIFYLYYYRYRCSLSSQIWNFMDNCKIHEDEVLEILPLLLLF